MSSNAYIPSPHHAADAHVFLIGENEIIRVEERKESEATGTLMTYIVSFKDAPPKPETVEEAIEIMAIFKLIEWDFQLLADMRLAHLTSQLRHAGAYSRLIGLIKNPHCKQCFVYMTQVSPIIGSLFTSTIESIVHALCVPCSIINCSSTEMGRS